MERRELIETAKQLIEKYDLKNPTRFQRYTYPRYYLFAVLRKDGKVPFVEIARMFDKNHATVIHGLNVHELLTEQKDLSYKYFTAAIRDEIKLQERNEVRSLEDDVLHCHKISQLKMIKEKIKMGYYD